VVDAVVRESALADLLALRLGLLDRLPLADLADLVAVDLLRDDLR
jgi:hypothetical protein